MKSEGINSMSTSIEAIYERGVLRPVEPLALPEGSKVSIVLLDTDVAKLAVVRDANERPAVPRRPSGNC